MGPLELANAKALVPSSRWQDFVQYMQTGEADGEFRDHLQRDDLCREAVTLVIEEQRKMLDNEYRKLIHENPRGFGGYQKVFNRLMRSADRPITAQDVESLRRANDY